MKNAKKWVVIGGLILLSIWQITLYTDCVNREENINVSDKKMYTSVDTMVKQIEGSGFVIKNLRGTIIEALTAYVGEGGRKSGSFINAVKEAIPEIPESAWENMQATMNAAYKSFETAQNDKQIRIGEYKKKLRYPQYILVKMIGGFPTIDLEELSMLVVGETAKTAQETKQIETVDPFKKE